MWSSWFKLELENKLQIHRSNSMICSIVDPFVFLPSVNLITYPFVKDDMSISICQRWHLILQDDILFRWICTALHSIFLRVMLKKLIYSNLFWSEPNISIFLCIIADFGTEFHFSIGPIGIIISVKKIKKIQLFFSIATKSETKTNIKSQNRPYNVIFFQYLIEIGILWFLCFSSLNPIMSYFNL